jgi:hypothetical protein
MKKFSLNVGVLAMVMASFFLHSCKKDCSTESAQNREGKISAMFCASAKASGTIVKGIYYSGISCKIPYYGANAGYYSAIETPSTGVEGLKATAQAGVFAAGSGQLEFRIS